MKKIILLFLAFFMACTTSSFYRQCSKETNGPETKLYFSICSQVDKSRITDIWRNDKIPKSKTKPVTLDELVRKRKNVRAKEIEEQCDYIITKTNEILVVVDKLLLPYEYSEGLAFNLNFSNGYEAQWRTDNAGELTKLKEILKSISSRVPDLVCCIVNWEKGEFRIVKSEDGHMTMILPLSVGGFYGVTSVEDGLMIGGCSDDSLHIEVKKGCHNNMADYITLDFATSRFFTNANEQSPKVCAIIVDLPPTN
jgi:hypothetical protein